MTTTPPTITIASKATNPRYASSAQHDIARCEHGLPPILGVVCPCNGALFGKKRGDGPEFFAHLPESDPHTFKALPSQEAELRPRSHWKEHA